MAEFSSGEVAQNTGIAPSALRYYEQLGLVTPARREGGKRRYDAQVYQRLAIIQFAQQAGFTLPEIQTLLTGFTAESPQLPQWRTLAEQKLPEIEALIARAQGMKQLLVDGLRCGCLSLDACPLIQSTQEQWVTRRKNAPIELSG